MSSVRSVAVEAISTVAEHSTRSVVRPASPSPRSAEAVFAVGLIGVPSSVKVTFTKITKGEAHDDLYVGELRFWE